MQSFELEKIQTRIRRLCGFSLSQAISDMKYILLLFITFHLIIACGSTEKKTYKLTDEELAHLLFDIHFADVILTDITPEQKDSLETVYWKKMSEIYDMSKEEIRE